MFSFLLLNHYPCLTTLKKKKEEAERRGERKRKERERKERKKEGKGREKGRKETRKEGGSVVDLEEPLP